MPKYYVGGKKRLKGDKKRGEFFFFKYTPLDDGRSIYLSIYPSILLNVFYTHCTIYNNQRMIKMLDGYYKSRRFFNAIHLV